MNNTFFDQLTTFTGDFRYSKGFLKEFIERERERERGELLPEGSVRNGLLRKKLNIKIIYISYSQNNLQFRRYAYDQDTI